MGGSVKLSKKMSWILRHKAEKFGLTVRSDGYVRLLDLLSLPGFKGTSISDIEEVVQSDSKQRFGLIEEDGVILIRTNQGHTLRSVKADDLLTRLECSDTIDSCIHGTYYDAWEKIKVEGLSPMRRNHVHFAAGEVDAGEVISGMRTSAQVKIYIDIARAMRAGVPFYRSANNVILSPGLDGVVSPDFFERVVDVKTGAMLPVKAAAPSSSS